MVRWWRWVVVAVGVAALVAMPTVVGALPVAGGDRDASLLLARVKASGTTPYAGYAESAGALALPVSEQLSSLSELLGGQTRLRVWWRGARDFRLDTLDLSGERDLHRSGDNDLSWDYEDNRVAIGPAAQERELRLPFVGDVLPSELGRRLLGEAMPSEVTSLPARRVAGRDADGLRMRPADTRSTVARVDVWADRATGIPLAVHVYAAGARRPAVSCAFLDFSTELPGLQETSFEPPPSARLRPAFDTRLEDAVDGLPGAELPDRLVGLERQVASLGPVAVYGRGVTQLVVSPLRGRLARSLHEQLLRAPGAVVTDAGVSVALGPLTLLLTSPDEPGPAVLLTGTVSRPTLAEAGAVLVASLRGLPG